MYLKTHNGKIDCVIATGGINRAWMLAQMTPNYVLQSNQKRIFPSLSCMRSFALVYFAPMLHINRNAAHIWYLLVVHLHAQNANFKKINFKNLLTCLFRAVYLWYFDSLSWDSSSCFSSFFFGIFGVDSMELHRHPLGRWCIVTSQICGTLKKGSLK